MIYTVTFNPAIDYVLGVDELKIGEVNRSAYEEVYFGGKGINVSTVLKNLEVESIALGFVAGFTGDAIEKGLREAGVSNDFIRLADGMTRINVKIKSNKETEINGQGPVITPEALDELFDKIDQIKQEDVLVLAGSIPSTMPDDIYEKMLAKIKEKNLKVVVDATKDLLMNVLKYHPFLIKPNKHELGEMFGLSLNSDEDVIHFAKELQKKGAQNVLVSMGGEGSILIDESGKFYKMPAPKGTVVSSVGAGDSMVAGFMAGYLKWNDYEKALQLGTAAGSATAFSKGLATKEAILQMFERIEQNHE